MPFKHILASKSAAGEISLFDRRDEFMASYKDGKWVVDLLFDPADLEEDFKMILDDEEILRLMKEARTALDAPAPSEE